jgi:hypothetical protein
VEQIDKQLTIGSSEAGDLLNVEEFGRGCVRALAYKKLGTPEDFPDRQRDMGPLVRGQRLEPIAADIYEELTGRKTIRTKTHIHKDFPWARTSVDRTIRASSSNGYQGTGDLELKSRSEGMWWKIKREGSLPGTVLQAQWHMWVTGHKWASIGELGVFGSLPMLTYDVLPDKDVQNIFQVEGAKFAAKVFEKRQLPEPPFEATDKRCAVCSYRLTCRGESVNPTEWEIRQKVESTGKNLISIEKPELNTMLEDLQTLKNEKVAIEEAIDVAKEQVLSNLIGYDGAVVKNYGIVYRVPVVVSHLDTKRLREEQRAIYDQYFVKHESGNYKLLTYPNKEKEHAKSS